MWLAQCLQQAVASGEHCLEGLDCCSVLVALWVSFSLFIYLLFANAAKTAGGGGVHSSTQRGSSHYTC